MSEASSFVLDACAAESLRVSPGWRAAWQSDGRWFTALVSDDGVRADGGGPPSSERSIAAIERDGGVLVERNDERWMIARATERSVAHSPSVCEFADGWLAAYLVEDTGKVVLEVAALRDRAIERRRVAEAWVSLDALAASAPSVAATSRGVLLAWRQHRGPSAGVYLHFLDGAGRIERRELRLNGKGAVLPVAVALAATDDRYGCLFAEDVGDGPRVTLCVGVDDAALRSS